MANALQTTPTSTNGAVEHLDANVIGAGVTGLYQLYQLLKLGLSVRIYEAGVGRGGTWYWNRYPGCRFDSESYTHGYSFSEELLVYGDEYSRQETYLPSLCGRLPRLSTNVCRSGGQWL